MALETVAILTCVLAAASVRPITEIPILRAQPAAFDGPRGYRPQTLASAGLQATGADVNTVAQSTAVQIATSPFDRIATELDWYLSLQPGWDGEGSLVPTKSSVELAKAFLRTLPTGVPPPKPMVSRNGAAELYWDLPSGYLDVSFDARGSVSVFAETPEGKDFFLDAVAADFSRFPRQLDLLALIAPDQLRFVA